MGLICDQLKNISPNGRKWLAVLVDPEDAGTDEEIRALAGTCEYARVDLILVGGSLADTDRFRYVVKLLKSCVQIPVLIFPGNAMQTDENADGILLLSLISGRNADLLIGQHVQAAPVLMQSSVEIISCGYMLVNGGNTTSVQYISQTIPIPGDKPDLAVATAFAGTALGLSTLYLEAGSGARIPVREEMIRAVKKTTSVPLFVGGGLNSPEDVQRAWKAGADVAVVGSAIEKDRDWLLAFAHATGKNPG